jgi:uncharacterized protein (TIGR02466 family)
MPTFLADVKKFSSRLLRAEKTGKGVNADYPVVMTSNFFAAPEVAEFASFVGNTSWNILSEQGYAMDGMDVMFSEMWVQEHHKHSLMEQHTHRFGSQIVGFYFLDVPDPAPQAVFYDPRVAAVHAAWRERDPNKLTMASSAVTYTPKPGMFIFTNAWLAHGFSKNLSSKPFKFVHFTLYVAPSVVQPTSAEPLENTVVEVV